MRRAAVIGVGSVKGSPGATVTGYALAACWPTLAYDPSATVVVVEADPAGGDLAAYCGLGEDPGLATFATAARRSGTARPVALLEHAQPTGSGASDTTSDGASDGVFVVPGPIGASRARGAVELLAARPGLLAASAAASGIDLVLVDVGRLDQGSPAEALLGELDVLLLVCRAGAGALAHLAARGPAIASLRATARADWAPDHARGFTGVVLVGPCRYRTGDIEDAVGLPVVARLPLDDDAVTDVLTGRAGARRDTARRAGRRRARPLVQLVCRLTDQLDAATSPVADPLPPTATGPAELGHRAPQALSAADPRATHRHIHDHIDACVDIDGGPDVAGGQRVSGSAEAAGWTRGATVHPSRSGTRSAASSPPTRPPQRRAEGA